MKKGDFVILALALVLAALPLLLLIPADAAPAEVLVRQDGRLLRTLPLDTDCTVEFTTDHGTNVVQVSGGAASPAPPARTAPARAWAPSAAPAKRWSACPTASPSRSPAQPIPSTP